MQAEALSHNDNTTSTNTAEQPRQDSKILTGSVVSALKKSQQTASDFYNCGQDIENVVVLSIN